MSEPFIQQKGEVQAYAVEPGNPNEHHLQTDDAEFGQSTISEKAQYALSTVAGKRVLVGAMSFNISGGSCTPRNMTGISQCSGQGMIMAKDDSLLQSRGMYALKVGDEGQCNGVGLTSDGKPVPVTCRVCIGEHLQMEQLVDDDLQTAAVQESTSDKLNRFPIRLEYEDGSPAKGEKWKAVGSEGTKDEGILDENGEWVIEMLDEFCTVTFPEFDPSVDARPEAKRDHAFKLVEDLIQAGKQLGLSNSVELLEYWRSGGDDKKGDNRPDECWIDPFGRGKWGKRLNHNLFSQDHLQAVIDRLGGHRERYEMGTAERIWVADVDRTGQTFAMKFEGVSGDWLGWNLLDLQFGFGHCTIYSRVTVRVLDIHRKKFEFVSWDLALADRYDWEYGKSRWPGVMTLVNTLHFARYWKAENPQEILHAMESPYGFRALDFERVYARPFDIETEFYSLKTEEAPELFKPFVLDL